MTRQQQNEIRSYAEKLGLRVERFEKRSKHDAAILSNGRRSRFITLSATPSDVRARYAVQQDIRKIARELREQESKPAPQVIEPPKPKPTFSWLAEPVVEPLPEVVRPPEIEIVYFYTTTAALPFILGRKQVHDRHHEHLHATESRNGEKTDTGAYRLANRREDPYRAGTVCRVRFACYANDFEKIDADNYTRAEPLPLDRVIACDVRRYLGHKWVPFDLNSQVYRQEDHPGYLGVEINGCLYAAAEREMDLGHHSRPNVVSVLPEGRENASIHAGSGAIWGTPGNARNHCAMTGDGRKFLLILRDTRCGSVCEFSSPRRQTCRMNGCAPLSSSIDSLRTTVASPPSKLIDGSTSRCWQPDIFRTRSSRQAPSTSSF
jgi:hypothetical protein